MGIKELVLEKAKEEGWEKGREEGLKRAARNLLKASILTNEQIAAALEVSLDYVSAIRKELQEGK